jgi:hypothetical protein
MYGPSNVTSTSTKFVVQISRNMSIIVELRESAKETKAEMDTLQTELAEFVKERF